VTVPQRLHLGRDAGNRLLRVAKREVVRGDLGQQGDVRVAQARASLADLGDGGFGGTAGAAEDIDLPGGVKAGGPNLPDH
jgi:hypothetical protein